MSITRSVKIRAGKSIDLPGLVGDCSRWRKRSVPLFGKDDCMDAGGRAPKVGALGDAWSSCRGVSGDLIR